MANGMRARHLFLVELQYNTVRTMGLLLIVLKHLGVNLPSALTNKVL